MSMLIAPIIVLGASLLGIAMMLGAAFGANYICVRLNLPDPINLFLTLSSAAIGTAMAISFVAAALT